MTDKYKPVAQFISC